MEAAQEEKKSSKPKRITEAQVADRRIREAFFMSQFQSPLKSQPRQKRQRKQSRGHTGMEAIQLWRLVLDVSKSL
jgi:hypothetical protein